MGQLGRTLSALVCVALCGCEPAPPPAELEAQPALEAYDYDFVVRSAALGSELASSQLRSEARGRLRLTPLDDPPLWVSHLQLTQAELRAQDQALSQLEPGEWPLLARRSSEGGIDALWFEDETPSAAQSLARFVLAQMQTSAGSSAQETTSAGEVTANYRRLQLPSAQLILRTRSSLPGAAQQLFGLTLLLADERGPRALVSAQLTRAEIDGPRSLGSLSVLVARPRSQRRLSETESAQLAETVEALSASAPVPVPEQPLSEEAKDELRRRAQSWLSVRNRLLSASEAATPQLIGRASAYLRVDPTALDELRDFLGRASTSTKARAEINLALAECGTIACQELLSATLSCEGEQESLGAITRIADPSDATIEALRRCVGTNESEQLRAALGTVLARAAATDEARALAVLDELLEEIEGCPPALERWLVTLGNAGLLGTKARLLACLDEQIPEARQVMALHALRRVPGDELTATFLHRARTAPSALIRVTSLRALSSRALRPEQLQAFQDVDPQTRSTRELDELLGLCERVSGAEQLCTEFRAERDAREDEAP